MPSQKKQLTTKPAPKSSVSPSKLKSVGNAARSRAAKALANARQRCTNENNPDYAAYGGKGIMVLFKDVNHLIGTIGLPKPDETLDRINPHEHYEPTNVRWANAAVQGANKKSSSGNSHLSVDAQIIAAKEAMGLSEERTCSTVGWMKTLKAFNQGHLPSHDAEWMAAHLRPTGVLQSNFDFDTVADLLNSWPGYMHLPALSLAHERVRIRA